MIVCSNVLTDHDVRSTLSGDDAARTAAKSMKLPGCSACAGGARTIRPDHERGAGRRRRPRCRANGNSKLSTT